MGVYIRIISELLNLYILGKLNIFCDVALYPGVLHLIPGSPSISDVTLSRNNCW